MSYYNVVSIVSERETIFKADSTTEAKKLACKEWGINPYDKWFGISVMKAYRLPKEEEGNHRYTGRIKPVIMANGKPYQGKESLIEFSR